MGLADRRTSRRLETRKQFDPRSHTKNVTKHRFWFELFGVSSWIVVSLPDNRLALERSPWGLVRIVIIIVIALLVGILSMIDIVAGQTLNLFEILLKNLSYSIAFLLDMFVFVL